MSASADGAVQEIYEFGPFRLDPLREVLLRDGEPVALTPKAVQILVVLVRAGSTVVTKEDLMQAVWPDTFVEEANLSRNIFLLRKALGETPQEHRYIVTVPGRGYRMAEHVRRVAPQELSVIAPPDVSVVTASRSQVEVSVRETRRRSWVAVLVFGVIVVSVAAWWQLAHRSPLLGERDTVVLAEIVNSTGDAVFDETLRQGLKVQLEQSPFLSLVSEDRIHQSLKMMGRPADTRLTPDVAREICQRTSSALVLDGSIATLGSHYVLALGARNCLTGEPLADEQTEVAKKEDVLTALDSIAARLRGRLGESRASVRQHSTPLVQATTTSLDALQAYSTGVHVSFVSGAAAAIPLLERAIAIDPRFALAHAHLGLWYSEVGESARSQESGRRAYELRDNVSEPERFFIASVYQRQVLGDLDASRQTLEQWTRAYPRDPLAHSLLSGFSSQGAGRYEQSIAEAWESIAIDPDLTPAYANLGFANLYTDHVDAATEAVRQATERKLETPEILLLRYYIAFLKGDNAEMKRAAAAARNTPGAEDWIAFSEALGLARAGRLRDARSANALAVELARAAGQRERAATYLAGQAVWEALYEDPAAARRSATSALAASNGRDVVFAAAYALARSGDFLRCRALADDLERRFPADTSVRFNYLPALRGLLALHDGSPPHALEALQAARPYESAVNAIDFFTFFGGLYPIHVRGDADLAAGKAADAAAEFQKIVSHRGLLVADPAGPIALLQLARARALAGDFAPSRSAYESLFEVWKSADADVALVQRARAEYAKLSSNQVGLSAWGQMTLDLTADPYLRSSYPSGDFFGTLLIESSAPVAAVAVGDDRGPFYSVVPETP